LKNYWTNCSEERRQKARDVARRIGWSLRGKPSPRKGKKGPPAWNKGLTKFTDDRVAKNAATLSAVLKLHPRPRGRKLEEILGPERAAEVREKHRAATAKVMEKRRGKTYSEIYGVKKTLEIISKFRHTWKMKMAGRRLNLDEDLKFAEEVLIQKNHFYSFYERNGLREHPYLPSRWPGDGEKIYDVTLEYEDSPTESLTSSGSDVVDVLDSALAKRHGENPVAVKLSRRGFT
jgi:hypothetical protein